MPRLVKFVKVTFDSFIISGELEMRERKALAFARALSKNHKSFIKEYNWYGRWRDHSLVKDQLHLKVSFTVIYKPYVRKNKRI